MIADVWTVMWKEWKEFFMLRGSRRSSIVSLLVVAGVLGIFMPLQMGHAWVESPAVLATWTWVSLYLVTFVTADSFAGERERHTLETLLASRLSDRAILLGKAGAAIGYGWGLTLIGVLLGLITVNLAYGHGELLLYSPLLGAGVLVFSLLGAGLAAGSGILVSLRAPTVRQAQQSLSIVIMLLLFVPVFGIQALPAEWKARLAQALATADVSRIILVVAIVLFVLDLGLLLAAMARFQRARLVLEK
ncbi:MAG: ABC transporter permease subunit [Anaerolineales bacterium]|nr:ABC transporter permease subunit [Anaerolineales bacterium]